ncbi:MAG TPA: translocation/assembly module TamB domain-containing protein [Vicinamibacterales bacterium]|nr:translocation/assembly module TamB domain-containing protein [Vicinamibacterales bacterium]
MRIVRRLVHVLVIVITLVIGAAAAAIIVSQTAWFKNWLRGYIVREANQYINGKLSIERLGGNLFFGVEMENIGVSMDGTQVVAVKDLGLKYDVFELLTKGLSVDEIRLDHPVIYLKREGDTWQLSRLVKKQETEADRSGPGKPIAIDAIEIADGSVALDPVGTSGVDVPKKFEHLDAKVSFKYEPVRYSIEITHISFRGTEPSLALNALSGGIAVHDDAVHVEKLALRTAESSISVDGAVQNYLTKPNLNLQITSDKLSIPEIARIVPALAGVKLQPAFEIKTQGTFDQLHVNMNVRSSAGNAIGNVVADILEPGQAVKGDLTVSHIDLAQILNNPKQKSDITANAHVDVHGESFQKIDSLRGGVSLESPRIVAAGYTAGPIDAKAQIEGRHVALTAKAQAYGASATASGRVTVPVAKSDVLAFDVSGQLRNVDLRNMPKDLKIPPADTHVSAGYHVAGTAGSKDPAYNIHGDLKFEPSTVAGAKIAGGSRAGFSMAGKNIGYDADATVANLDLQRVGHAFKVPALDTDRYKSDINAHLVAKGSGTKPEEMNVDASGSLTNTTVMGGQIPQLDFTANIANNNAHVTAYGTFNGFDPAMASGNDKLKGQVGGDLNVDATVANFSNGVTPDSVQATAQLDLNPSTVGGLEITRANVDGDYYNSTGDVRNLEVVGRDVNVNGYGTIALNDDGQSNFKLHADSPSLATIGKLVDQPLTGIAKIDATVTGNRTQLNATGNLTGDGFKYGDNGALTASSDFTAKLPDLDIQEATISANTHATFVTVGGQNINELTAKTDYNKQNVDFDVNAKQPQRSLALGGSVALHPDHQEIHLKSLNLSSQGVSWQLAQGAQPAIQYGDNAVAVKDMKLVNGDQQITADGTFGKPGDALKVSLNNIDVATVDALLLRPPQLSGRLNATSTIRGTKEDPNVDANFEINQGGFRQFKYDSLKGTVKYAGTGVNLDARLQQNPTTWLEAKGYAPMALFNGTGANSNEKVDLHVDSSPIDLGLVQGFTTALTNVRGTMEAHVAVTGTAADPNPDGSITIQNAAFNVEPTGVNYTDLEGRIDLKPDRVHIEQIKLLDNQQKPLTITGDLAVNERKLGGVSIKLTADDFKVIDNKMGNVRIKSDMSLTGDLNAPRVEGELGVTTGRIDLDPILAQTGTSAYATQETEYGTNDANQQGQTQSPSAFEALQMDLHVTVPDDLVIKASDLRAPGAPLSLGAMNITMGGDVWVTKSPWDQIRIVGPVKTIRGFYDFQGRRFTILRDGTIRFEGLDDIDPSLDIRTQRVIQAVTANVNVRGSLKKPEIELSSTPPLEQADIMSLIVFNQPLNQTSEQQQVSIAQRAEQMAAGAATGAIAKSVGNAIGVDLFEINLAPDSGSGPNVTVGQQVSQNLYLKVEQGIGDASQTNVILEYELTNWLRFRTNVLQGSSTQQSLFQRAQGSGADLLFFFSY